MKTNKEKNQEHDARQKARVRPAPKEYAWEGLEAVIRQWKVRSNEQA
jgi:hypothetical protein